MPMLSGLMCFQPCVEGRGKSSGSVLIVALGNESLGCRNKKPSNQQGRKDDGWTAWSCLGSEQQHGVATKTIGYPARAGTKQRLPQTFVAEIKAQQITTGKRKSSPCTASQTRAEPDGLARGFVVAETVGETVVEAVAGNTLRGRIKEWRIHSSARKGA